MEYKNLREIYKGSIYEIKFPSFIGTDSFDDYLFKFDKTININPQEYMFIKEGCYLYEIISGYVFPFFKKICYDGTYGISSKCIDVPNYAVLDDLYEAQLIEVEEYIKKMLIKYL